MNVLDLFSGIGGFSLGLERAGMRTIAFCEIDPYCRAVLKKHWPTVPVFGDVTKLSGAEVISVANAVRRDGRQDYQGQTSAERNGHPQTGDVADTAWNVRAEQTSRGTERQRIGAGGQSIDVIAGGFPCQDISLAGKGAGIEGERSGLWKEYARIIGEVRPRYVIVENVAALLHRGLERVLGDLAALGFDAEWHCIPACAIGAPHRRDRVWIVAHAQRNEQRQNAEPNGCTISLAGRATGEWRKVTSEIAGCRSVLADTAGERSQRGGNCNSLYGQTIRQWTSEFERGGGGSDGWWLTEPDVGRVAHGVPARVDRLRALGNSIVPQIAEIIGRAIIASEGNA